MASSLFMPSGRLAGHGVRHPPLGVGGGQYYESHRQPRARGRGDALRGPLGRRRRFGATWSAGLESERGRGRGTGEASLTRTQHRDAQAICRTEYEYRTRGCVSVWQPLASKIVRHGESVRSEERRYVSQAAWQAVTSTPFYSDEQKCEDLSLEDWAFFDRSLLGFRTLHSIFTADRSISLIRIHPHGLESTGARYG